MRWEAGLEPRDREDSLLCPAVGMGMGWGRAAGRGTEQLSAEEGQAVEAAPSRNSAEEAKTEGERKQQDDRR